jgi:hypothetical protein
VAIFKPAEEEGFSRAGLLKGEGAVREEAAFLLDSLYGGFSGVPSTALASMPSPRSTPMPAPAVATRSVSEGAKPAPQGEQLQGSIQAWVDAAGSMEDYGMPHDLAKASKFVSVQEVQKIAALDIRLFNTDRHGGNILLSKEDAKEDVDETAAAIHSCSFRLEGIGGDGDGSMGSGGGGGSSSSGIRNSGKALIPIDHGCILPSWHALSEARFDWLDWPQADCAMTPATVAHINSLSVIQDRRVLRKLGVREECIDTMQICTMLLKLGCQMGSSFREIGNILQRSGSYIEPSPLERCIGEACAVVGIPFCFVENNYGEKVAQVGSPRSFDDNSCKPGSAFYQCLREQLAVELAAVKLPAGC